MSDPDRNPQHARGHNWFPEEAKKPPPDTDVRQRRPATNEPTPVANPRVKEVPSIAGQRDSRTAESPARKNIFSAARSKTGPGHKRRPPSFVRVVKIVRRFLDPRGRP